MLHDLYVDVLLESTLHDLYVDVRLESTLHDLYVNVRLLTRVCVLFNCHAMHILTFTYNIKILSRVRDIFNH